MEHEVIIVGAGPAGLMLACELGLAGIRPLILERRAEPRTDPPGVAINTASVELLESRGLMDPLRELTFPLPQVHFALLALDTQSLPERHRNQVLVTQYNLERVLENRALDYGAEIRRGCEVVGLDAGESGVTVAVRSPTGEQSERCHFLVGCDGPDSTVRQFLDIEFSGAAAEYTFQGLIGDIEVDVQSLPAHHRVGAFYHSSGGVYMAVPLGPDAVRVTTWEALDTPPSPEAPVTMDELRASILRVTGSEFAGEKPRWMNRVENRIRQAEHYRQGPVFLAGDAAHVIFPYNGQALNNALHDAANLGWKLATAIDGRAPSGLLDSYHDERHAAGRLVATNIHAQVTLTRGQNDIGGLRELIAGLVRFDEVNRHLVEMMTNLDVCYSTMRAALPSGEQHPLVGCRLAPTPLVTSGGRTSTSSVLRTGRGVVVDFTAGVFDAGELKAWGDHVDVIAADPAPDVDATVLLLRPDGHVAWATDATTPGDEGLRAALATWFGA